MIEILFTTTSVPFIVLAFNVLVLFYVINRMMSRPLKWFETAILIITALLTGTYTGIMLVFI